MKSDLIDPNFDKIPVDEVYLTPEERDARLRATPRQGLSINNTIARDANLSIGAQGVNTSTVPSGASAEEAPSVTPSVDHSDSENPESLELRRSRERTKTAS